MSTAPRRELMGTSAALATAAILPGRQAMGQGLAAHEEALHEAAKGEGELTWYTGHLQVQPSEAIGFVFTAWCPCIRCNIVRTTPQVAFQRLSQDHRASVAQCDVFSSNDYSHFTFLKREGRLMPYWPINTPGMVKDERDASDPDGYFQMTYLELYLLARRSDQLNAADAPRSWRDLTDAKWRDKLADGHPGFSGAIGNWAIMMQKAYGEGYFCEFERRRPLIGRSAGDPITTLNVGERVVGVGVPFAATLFCISRGNPLTLIYPMNGTLMVPAPSAALAIGPRPNAARLFVEIVTSSAYSEATCEFFAESLRPEVPPPEGSRPLDDIRLISPTSEEIERDMPEVRELWRDVFGV